MGIKFLLANATHKAAGDLIFFGNNLSVFFEDFIQGLLKGIGIAFYMISYTLFLFIDFLSIVFKKLLGLGEPYSINMTELGGAADTKVSGDLVLKLIQSKTIQNIFIALSVIALFLLVISAIVAIVRTEYKWDKDGNSKGPILGKALKAIALYFTVPVACVFGIFGVSYILKAVDQATGSDSGYVSSMIFSACSGSGNRIRNDDTWEALKIEYENKGNNLANTTYCYLMIKDQDKLSDLSNETRNRELLANSIDQMFENRGASFSSGNKTVSMVSAHSQEFDFSGVGLGNELNNPTDDVDGRITKTRAGFKAIRNTNPNLFKEAQVCSPYNIEVVWFFYDLGFSGYNHILSIIVTFLIMKCLFDMTCGVVKRLYELVVLYAISPPIVALMPLDNGSAYSAWVKAFIGKVLMGFGGVLAINFFFMLVPVFRTIVLFDSLSLYFASPYLVTFFNYLCQLLFVLVGGFSLNSLSKMISSLIGGEDAAESGGVVSGQVKGAVGKIGGIGVAGAKIAGKGAKWVGGGAVKIADKFADKIKPPTPGAGGPSSLGGPEAPDAPGGPSGSGGSGGSGGTNPSGNGGNPEKTLMGNGRIANFLRNNKVVKTATGAIKGAAKIAGAGAGVVGGAFLGGEGMKGFQEGEKQATDVAKNVGEGVADITKAVYPVVREPLRIAGGIVGGMVKGSWRGRVNGALSARSYGGSALKYVGGAILGGFTGAAKGAYYNSILGREINRHGLKKTVNKAQESLDRRQAALDKAQEKTRLAEEKMNAQEARTGAGSWEHIEEANKYNALKDREESLKKTRDRVQKRLDKRKQTFNEAEKKKFKKKW